MTEAVEGHVTTEIVMLNPETVRGASNLVGHMLSSTPTYHWYLQKKTARKTKAEKVGDHMESAKKKNQPKHKHTFIFYFYFS